MLLVLKSVFLRGVWRRGPEVYHVACHDALRGQVLEGCLQSEHFPEDNAETAVHMWSGF